MAIGRSAAESWVRPPERGRPARLGFWLRGGLPVSSVLCELQAGGRPRSGWTPALRHYIFVASSAAVSPVSRSQRGG